MAKKLLKISDLRSKNEDEIRKDLAELRMQMYKLREKRVVEELSNPFEMVDMRRQVARLLTLLRERQLAAEAAPKKKNLPRRKRRQAEAAR